MLALKRDEGALPGPSRPSALLGRDVVSMAGLLGA